MTNFKNWFKNKYFETEYGYVIQDDFFTAIKNIPDNIIDLNISDIPYGTTNCRWDTIWNLDVMWEEINRTNKLNTPTILTAQTPFDKILGASNIKNLKYEYIWEKNKSTGFLNAKRMPMKAHENCLVFYKKLPTYNPQKTYGHKPVNNYTKHTSDGENYNSTKKGITGGGSTERYPRSILKIPVMNNDDINKFHPTQKPLELYEYFIKTYTNENDLVLDMAAGALTCAIACEKLRRKYIVIEKDIDNKGNNLDYCRRGKEYFKNIFKKIQ